MWRHGDQAFMPAAFFKEIFMKKLSTFKNSLTILLHFSRNVQLKNCDKMLNALKMTAFKDRSTLHPSQALI
jgi:hypothetical protein